jgi:hypothetical protein|tara:strand:- start:217 stop:873 length:657 start_codon:yes stop_codon:yes gene_type:complete
MSKDSESSAPEHIKKFEELKKKYKRLLDTTKLAHTEAYLQAVETIKDKKGNVDYELLEEEGARDKFADAMVGHYVLKAKEYFGSDISGDDVLQVDMLLNAYTGATKTELENLIKKQGKNYTLDKHEQTRNRLVGKIANQIRPTIYSSLKDEHKGDLIQHMGLEGLVDESSISIEDLAQIHDIYEESGVVTEKSILNQYGHKPVFLKKAKKAEKYEPKD